MKPRFRQSMNWLHTWTGFTFGWLLYFIFITGTVGYFENEIDRWMKPEVPVIEDVVNQDSVLDTAEKKLQELAADSPKWYISFPIARAPYVGVQWLQLADEQTNTPRKWHDKNIDLKSNSVIAARETAGGKTLYRMHYKLHYMPKLIGYILTSLAAMLMLIGLITGIVIHKKIFIEFFTFRPRKGMRSWIDIHNIFSVLPLPFHLMITYSGLLLLMGVTMSNVIDVRYGEGKVNYKKFYKEAQLEIKDKEFIDILPTDLSLKTAFNDARTRYQKQKISYIGLIDRGQKDEHYEVWFDKYVGIHSASSIEYRIKNNQVEIEISRGMEGSAAKVYDLFEHLHEGLFANIYLRWLYFVSGLLGAGMIATGMILWIKKRYKNGVQREGLNIITIIDRLNTGVVVGLPIAIACYFWSNRLLPLTLDNRADWEVHCFFMSLLACLCFCLCRNPKKIWVDTLWIAAVVYALIPVLNIFTTEHSLITSLYTSDWLMLGFDLSMLFFAGCFAISAMIIKREQNKESLTTENIVNSSKQKKLQDIPSC